MQIGLNFHLAFRWNAAKNGIKELQSRCLNGTFLRRFGSSDSLSSGLGIQESTFGIELAIFGDEKVWRILCVLWRPNLGSLMGISRVQASCKDTLWTVLIFCFGRVRVNQEKAGSTNLYSSSTDRFIVLSRNDFYGHG